MTHLPHHSICVFIKIFACAIIGGKGAFVYISDVKEIPAETMEYLQSQPPIDTLVLDCIKVRESSPMRT